MPITDINVRTHPITDTDIRYEGHSVAVGLLLMPSPSHLPDTPELAGRIGVWATRLYARIKRPSVYAATVCGSKRRGGVGRHCPQALGQTVVIISKQATGAKQAGRGRGRCTQASLWVWHIDKHCSARRSRFTGHAVFTCGGYAGQPACMFTYCYGWIFNDWWLD